MAGYLINLDNERSLEKCIENGVYSTILQSQPDNYWLKPYEATLADYLTMKPGDNIYFFVERKIYGVGELVNVGDDCKYLNFPNANQPKTFENKEIIGKALWSTADEAGKQRWICLFKPAPYFFKNGIDMDEMLFSDPAKFKMLRVFWKLSFLKIDDEENQAFKNAILKHNQEGLLHEKAQKEVFASRHVLTHDEISRKIDASKKDYQLEIRDVTASCADGNKLKHEMAIEAALLYQLSQKEKEAISVFGEWDYLHHQVFASPFKPIDYMDKMDVFAYRFIKGYSPTISKYMVAEIKRDEAGEEDVEQTMKYVDWINQEYSHGDYSMISAFLVAADFDEAVIRYAQQKAERIYTIGTRPAKSEDWRSLCLVKYSYNNRTKMLNFIKL